MCLKSADVLLHIYIQTCSPLKVPYWTLNIILINLKLVGQFDQIVNRDYYFERWIQIDLNQRIYIKTKDEFFMRHKVIFSNLKKYLEIIRLTITMFHSEPIFF